MVAVGNARGVGRLSATTSRIPIKPEPALL
jgi:hypothetical protein